MGLAEVCRQFWQGYSLKRASENISEEKGGKMMENKNRMETEEEFISGFCKMQNQTRMVICETERLPDGRKKVVYADCAYGKCEHTGDCLLMGQLNG